MEAVHHELLFQVCLTCVTKLTWVFTLTTVGNECIPNIQAFSGTLHDHAKIRQEFKELRYNLIPLPNITEGEFQEWFNVTSMTSTTTMPTTTLPLTDLQKCYKSSFPDDLVHARASHPQKCQRVKWDRLTIKTTTSSPTPLPPTTELPVTMTPQNRVSNAGVTNGVVMATINGFLMIRAGYLVYIWKCREVCEDEEAFGRPESISTNWVFNYNRGQGSDKIDGVEMTAM